MKTNIISILITILFIAGFYSCSKESDSLPESKSKTHTYTADEMALWRQLNNFNQKIKRGLKSEEFISPDSAMWYLEALFNVQQAADTTFDEVKSYERTYTLSVNNNGTVNMSEVVSVYNQLVSDLNGELAQIDADYKFLIIADLKEESLKSGGFTMTLSGGLGINPLNYYQPFTSVDNWYYGHLLGRSDGAYLWVSDAGVELARRFNHPYIYYPPGTSWSNIDSREASNSNFPGRVYYEEAMSAPIIPYTSMQYYLTQGHYIIYNYPNDVPSGLRIENKFFNSMVLWTNEEPPLDHKYWHKYQIFYGTPSMLPEIR